MHFLALANVQVAETESHGANNGLGVLGPEQRGSSSLALVDESLAANG